MNTRYKNSKNSESREFWSILSVPAVFLAAAFSVAMLLPAGLATFGQSVEQPNRSAEEQFRPSSSAELNWTTEDISFDHMYRDNA